MKIAAISAVERGVVDRALSEAAARLAGSGYRLAGVVRKEAVRPHSGPRDTDLAILSTNQVIRITQNLGPHSKACRLDAGALEQAVGAVEAVLSRPSDLFILNKFGLREAEGGGFRRAIGEALAQGVPVLLGVSDEHRAAFETFVGGPCETLPADPERILGWAREAAPKQVA